MKKFLNIAVLIALLLAIVPASIAGAAPALQGGEDYTVQADDWLSKLADKFYGDVNAYWAIMSATNQANAEDPSYAKIENPDVLEVGAKLRIPSTEEAEAFMADFNVEADIDRLFASGAGGQLLVGNWWTSGGEFAGVNAVYELYRQEYPDVELIHAGIAGGAGVNFQAANLNKLIAGDPFDTFQLHAGLEAELYSPEQYLVPVDNILEEEGVLDVMPQDLKDLLKIRGNTYTVPLNIHRGNVMWTNTNVVEQAGIAVPTTFEEFFAVCETLQDQGIIPLGLGIADGFELGHTLEVVIAGTVGAEKNKGLWNGTVSWTDPDVTTALENYDKLLNCTNEDRGTIGWVGGIDLVINDQAAFNIMGDWAYGEVIAKGALDKVTWNSPPGNQGMFFLVSDGFAITVDAPNPDNANNFVRIITRKDAQEAFNQNKGSICARTDCDYNTFPADRRAYFQSAADDFADSAIIPMVTHGSGAIPSWQQQFSQIATQFASDRDVAAAQAALVLAAEDAGFPQ